MLVAAASNLRLHDMVGDRTERFMQEGGREGEEGREGSNQADKCTSSNYMKIQYLWTQGLCANFSFHLLSHLVA
jgi:hypothetical protein